MQPFPLKPARIEFDTENLGLEWNHIQLPDHNAYELDADQGVLRIKGSALTLGDRESPTFVGRRLQHRSFSAETAIDFDPENENEEAGLILLNNGSHFDLMINQSGGKRYILVKLQFGRTRYISERIELKPGPVKLKITGERSTFTLSFAQGNDDFRDMETVDAKFLSSETVGGFTGVYVGLYATGNGKASQATATFDWFEYTGE